MAAPGITFDFDNATKTATSCYRTITGLASSWGTPIFLSAGPAFFVSALVFVAAFLVLIALQVLLALGTWFGVSMLDVITATRNDNADDFNQLIGAALSELLGVNIDGSQLPGGKGPGGTAQRMEAIGSLLHDLLIGEFGGLSPITPATGAENARKFSGFGINFATASAFMSILTEAASVGFLKEFRELGVETAEAIGLGRMQRLAMQPLIRNMIQQPYDLYLKSQLRPDRLNEAQIVRALRAGQIDDGDAHDALAEKGYPDDLIDILISDLTGKLSVQQVETLVRFGDLDEAAGLKRITDSGVDADTAKLQLKAAQDARVQSFVNQMLHDLSAAVVAGYIDQVAYNKLLGDLPLGGDEEDTYRKVVGFQMERPRKRITFAQLKTGVIDGIADFDYVDQWLTAEGYGPQDHQVLMYEIIQALSDAEAKAKGKTKAKQKAQAAGITPAPPLNT